jgi:hypothetical protein
MDSKVHARNRDTKELLCGRKLVPETDLSLEQWDSVAKEITCPECHANIPRFTAEEYEAALPDVLDELIKERR